MIRSALCIAVACWTLGGAAAPAHADGANVARFLAHNQLAPRKVTPFDAAFAKLQTYARDRGTRQAIGKPAVLLSRTERRQITGLYAAKAPMTSTTALLFDGRRAYLKLTTSSQALRPASTSKTVRVPLGRTFGWLGKQLVKAHFPELSARQVQNAVARAMR